MRAKQRAAASYPHRSRIRIRSGAATIRKSTNSSRALATRECGTTGSALRYQYHCMPP